jgi:hypothetical protein
VAVQSLEKLPGAIDALIAAVRAGELDQQLASAIPVVEEARLLERTTRTGPLAFVSQWPLRDCAFTSDLWARLRVRHAPSDDRLLRQRSRLLRARTTLGVRQSARAA